MSALTFYAWPEPADAFGHKPRSLYVETYWLGILGPSCTWAFRRIAALLDEAAAEVPAPSSLHVVVDRDDFARQLGLRAGPGKNCPFRRSLQRLEQFHLATSHVTDDGESWAVRPTAPQLPPRLVARLAPSLQESHGRLSSFLAAVAW